jgi:hypothetical protein
MKRILIVTLLLSGLGIADWIVTNPPDLSTFTWVNQLGSSCSTANGLPVFAVPFHSSPAQWSSLVKPLTASAYTITLIFIPSIPSAGIFHFGITLQDSTSTKGVNLMLNQYNAPGQLIVYRESDVQHGMSEVAQATFNIPVAHVRGLRIVDDGTNRTFYYSCDGGNVWMQMYQEASNSYMTPAKWGIIGVNLQSATQYATIYDLETTYP